MSDHKQRKSPPSRAKIALYWADLDVFKKFVWLLPRCFACCYIKPALLREQGDDSDDFVSQQWERSGLERCHLVPRNRGGSYDLSNLVLLCKRCHEDAPVIGRSPHHMIEWINSRENYANWMFGRLRHELVTIRPTLLQELYELGIG